MINSINTNIAAYFAQGNIGRASSLTADSVARLSSGNRIVRSSDDVAALAAGTSLRTQVTTLRTALINVSQGTSLLQVADGALSQVTEILQRQKAIALQAGSGQLTNTDRGFLNQEFQALASEINRLTLGTNFNGVSLLNGNLSQSAGVTDVTDKATKASATVTFSKNATDTETFIIAGVTLTAKDTVASTAQFQIGSTTAETVNNLEAKLNSLAENVSYATTIGQAKYLAVGNSLQIVSRTGGKLSDSFVIQMAGTTTTGSDGAIAGQFGGTYFTLFGTGFSSATSTVTATTAAASTPFQVGDTLTATVAGTSRTLHTFAASDGLDDIVNGINAVASNTGIKATLVFSQTAKTYNIQLSHNDHTRGMFVSLGTNYLGTTYTVNGIQDVAATGIERASTARTGGYQFAGYRDLFTSAGITATDTITSVTVATPTNAAAPFKNGDIITATVNGVVHNLHTLATTNTLNDIVDGINANFGTTGLFATVVGSSGAYNIRIYGSDSSNNIDPDAGTGVSTLTSNSAGLTTTGATLTQTTRYGLRGGLDDGIGLGNTFADGSIGDNLVTSLAQSRAKVVINFPDIASSALTSSTNFNTDNSVYMTVAGKNFTFTQTAKASAAPDEILIGATLKDTLDNAVETINNYFTKGYAIGDTAYQLNQMNISRDGNSLVFEGKDLTTVTNLAGSTSTVSITNFSGGASTTNSGNLDNASNKSGSQFGVDVTGISNASFTGSIQGFTATYKSSNTVDLQVKIGGYTYLAKDITSNVTSDTTIRFLSDTLGDGSNGGYFDVQLQANKGLTVSTQSDANTMAQRLDAAFSSLTFSQKRNVSSYTGSQSIASEGTVIGSLLGTKVSALLPSFSDNKLTDITVAAPKTDGADAVIKITIDGVNYVSKVGLGDQLGANQTFRFVNEENSDYYVEFTTGNAAIDLNTDAYASAVEDALKKAFGANAGSAALSFQIGVSVTDTLSVSIGDAGTRSIYSGKTLDVLTQANAATASSTLDTALATVTSIRANVGALQSRFNFASASIEISLQNQDAARGALLDTDVAAESTLYATNQVKLQAGISVLAQANTQLQALLKLIG